VRFEPGYGLRKALETQVEVLLFMLQEHDPGASLPCSALAQHMGEGVSHRLFSFVEPLRSDGLVWYPQTIEEQAEPISLALTATGLDLAQRMKDISDTPAARRRACRNAFLRWVNAARDMPQGTPHSVSISGTPYATFYGSAFTDQEVADASRWLKDNNFITGPGTWQAGILRARLTHKGEIYAEGELDVNQPERSPAGHHVMVSGHGNAVSLNSPGSVQSINVTVTDDHRKQLLQLADSIEQASTSLIGDDDDIDLPAQLREAAGQDDPSVVKRALARMQTVLIDEGSSALGSLILGSASALLTYYGVPSIPT
jgi:hypothetical protein